MSVEYEEPLHLASPLLDSNSIVNTIVQLLWNNIPLRRIISSLPIANSSPPLAQILVSHYLYSISIFIYTYIYIYIIAILQGMQTWE